jgi:hypothetical protein
VQPGDLLFGQLVSVDRLTMLEAGNGFAISAMEKAPIIELPAPTSLPRTSRGTGISSSSTSFMKLPIAPSIPACQRSRILTANHHFPAPQVYFRRLPN